MEIGRILQPKVNACFVYKKFESVSVRRFLIAFIFFDSTAFLVSFL